MNKQGSIIIVLLIVLIAIVLTSGLILFLVKMGVISATEAEEDVLLTEFIAARDGVLVVKDFTFCELVTEEFECVGETDTFFFEDEVHFLFTAETTPFEKQITLIENYRLIDPQGEILLDVNEEDNFHVDYQSERQREKINFKDYFIVHSGLPGEYTLELVLENPLLNKKTTLTKKVMLQ